MEKFYHEPENTHAENFEYRHYACPTCHRSLVVCPDCGQFSNNPYKDKKEIFCKSCNIPVIRVGDFLQAGENSMGQDGYYSSAVYECPKCHKRYAPGIRLAEDTYVKNNW